ncbi:MAG: hypothetical protein H0U74_14865 [Bradymonadaceae bacterium]|nr:hypothetical protein [Lujinxingiaceae bacterium]
MGMIEVSAPGSGLSPALLNSAGGFAWWYLDLVDAQGNGLVIIWSFGLPFLPGYAASARRGQAQTPGSRPSLNVATYCQGKADYYLLQEFDIEDVSWTTGDHGDNWRFGPSTLASEERDGERRVRLELHLDVPGHGGLTEIALEACGPARSDANWPATDAPASLRQHDPLPDHDWTPLLAASLGRAMIRNREGTRRLEGRVYHDRNGGQRAMHDLGIDIWVWGRIALPNSELIYYVLDAKGSGAARSEAIFLEIGADGSTTHHRDYQLVRAKGRRNLGGLRWWPTMHVLQRGQLLFELDHSDVVDSGPFYMRSVLRALGADGQPVGRGISEVCDPDRIDLAIHRPLVRMRVHHQSGDHSLWTPLFCGTRGGRVRRMLQSLLARG